MPVPITQGTGASSIASELIGANQYQQIKIVGGETGSTSVLGVTPDGALKVSVLAGVVASVSGSVGITGTPSISGAVTVVGNPSISGTVNIGTIPGSVVGFQGGTRTISGSVLSYMAPLASLVSGVTSIITSTSQTSVLATAAGGQNHHITHILVTNGAATATFVDIMSGPTVIYSGFAAASGGGFSASFPTPLRTPNAATSVDMKATAQASIKTAISGFTAP